MSGPFRSCLALSTIALVSGCASGLKVAAERQGENAWLLQVTDCSYSGKPDAAMGELDRQATKRCRNGWDAMDLQVNDRAMLGGTVFGECPAVRVRATVVCKGREP